MLEVLNIFKTPERIIREYFLKNSKTKKHYYLSYDGEGAIEIFFTDIIIINELIEKVKNKKRVIYGHHIGGMVARFKGDSLFARAVRGVGKIAEHAAPKIIKTVGALGTAAMFVVGGSMLLHGIPGGEPLLTSSLSVLGSNALLQAGAGLAAHAVVGVVAGFATIPVMKVIGPPLGKVRDFVTKLYAKIRKQPQPVEDKDDDKPAPLLEPQKDALKKVPDVKAALNAAVQPVEPTKQPEVNAQPAAIKPAA